MRLAIKVRIWQQMIPLLLALGACGGPLQLTKFTFESDELEECLLAAVPADAKLPLCSVWLHSK